ncbi:unnamed protein product [Ectocarpus fasciculatus]
MGRSQGAAHRSAPMCLLVVLSVAAAAVAGAAASGGPGPDMMPPTAADGAKAEMAEVLKAVVTMTNGLEGFQPPLVDGGILESEQDRSDGRGSTQEQELSRVVRGGTPGDFNLYIFAMSWKAEWCYHQSFPGCKKPRSFWETNLTIHGLWPDYGDGTYPTTCSSEPYDHDRVVNAIGLDVLETMWPNIQVPEEFAGNGKKYDSFWEHEWTKHGTCTGLSMEEYFSTAIALLQRRFLTPPQLTENVGGQTTRVDLEDAYGGEGMAVLDCRGKVHLNQVYLCLEPDSETHLPGEQVACPPAVVAHDDTCGQDSLDVAAFE